MNGVFNAERSSSRSPALSFAVSDRADPAARSLVKEGLDRFNVEQAGAWDNTPLDIVIRDEGQNIVGGLVGRTSLGVLFVDYLFVPERLRGRGCGRQALVLAEGEAVRRGCSSAVLFTMLLQAPGFYERCGYEVFGSVECLPAGNARVFMKKALGGEG